VTFMSGKCLPTKGRAMASITIISGGLGAGKTTLSSALARAAPAGLHLITDLFYTLDGGGKKAQKPIAGVRARPECMLIPHETRYGIEDTLIISRPGELALCSKNDGGLAGAAV
jgi:hypothetical protein